MSSSSANLTSSSSTGSSLSSLAEPLIANPTTDDPLSLFLIQIIIILVLVRILAKLLGRLRQPPVIGEIIAGIMLGPSVFGYIPNFSTTIFPTSSLTVISVFAQIGLIFFMFFLGLEVDIALLTRNWRAAAPVAITSIIIPFGAGVGISFWFYNIEPTTADQTTFLLFMGTSFSFTAFPVLARLLTSFRLLDAGVGVHTLSIAAIDDVLAWCVLAITLSYAGGGSAVQGVYTMLLVIAFVLVVVFIARPFLMWAGLFFAKRTAAAQAKGPGAEEFSRDYVALLFFLLACASIWTEIIGVHAFFGAFAFGVAVPKSLDLYAHEGIEHYGLVEYLAPKIELLVVEFFLPLYFANSGLSTQLGTLNTGELWGKAIALIIIATVAKMGPVTIMTRLTSTWFYVDTSDPDSDPELMTALDNEQEVLAERQEMGVMETAQELELATLVRETKLKEARQEAGVEDIEEDDLQAQLAMKHAEFADSGGMHRITISHMDAAGVKPVDTLVEEKRLQDSPPTTGGSAVIINSQPSAMEEVKEQEAVVTEDDDQDESKDREPSQQLSHRVRPQPRESVHFSDMHLDVDPHGSSSAPSSANNSPRNGSLVSTQPIKNKPVPIPWKVCFCIGVLMNTRGLVALIALNIGLQKGILGPKVFSLMVLMALVTTFITSPVFDHLFYRPYMREKREKREQIRQQLRREATQRKLIESGGKDVEVEPEETELERTARLRLEEEEDDRLRDEELNRNTLMIGGAFTPRAQSYVSHSTRSASPPWSWSRAATFSNLATSGGGIGAQANTVGAPSASAREGRGSLSGKQPASLYNLYQSQPSRTGLFNAGSPTAAYHLAEDSSYSAHSNGLKTSNSVGSMAKLNRGTNHSSSMHSLMQTTPSRLNLQLPLMLSSSQSAHISRVSTPNSRDVVAEHGRLSAGATRHPSDTSSSAGSGSDGITQTGPSRLHIPINTAADISPPPSQSPTGSDINALHSGPGRTVRHARQMSDIQESNTAQEDVDSGRD